MKEIDSSCNEHESCDCHMHSGHHHDEESGMGLVCGSAFFFVLGFLFSRNVFSFFLDSMYSRYVSVFFLFLAYVLPGRKVIHEALENLREGKPFSEEFLMSMATVGAILIGEYAEAAAVMVLFSLGEYLESKSSSRAKKSIESLMEIKSDTAVVLKNGMESTVSSESVSVGDVIVVKQGMRVPLDGIIVSGGTFADSSALTGESVPVQYFEGDEILSGVINSGSVIRIRVTKPYSESTVSRILELVENASSRKAKTEKFISRFARIYTPSVCLLAFAFVAVSYFFLNVTDLKSLLYRACELLVVSCPCALVISIPLSFFAGIGLCGKNGILVKGSAYVDLLSKVKCVVFDKTGTLTKGCFEITDIFVREESGVSRDELVSIASHAESCSTHPISSSLKKIHHCEKCENLVLDFAEEISGCGIKCMIGGEKILVGNEKLMEMENVRYFSAANRNFFGTVVYVARNSEYLGFILISDVLKDNVCEVVDDLKKLSVRTVMLSGDKNAAAEKVASLSGIGEYHAELLPGDKVLALEKIMEAEKGKILFAGDGINDAPVLMRADIGLSMGTIGSDAAVESSDVVVMNDDISKIPLAIRISSITMRNVFENIVFSIGVKIMIVVSCLLGYAPMWLAVFGDVGVTIISILNSLRLSRKSVRK